MWRCGLSLIGSGRSRASLHTSHPSRRSHGSGSGGMRPAEIHAPRPKRPSRYIKRLWMGLRNEDGAVRAGGPVAQRIGRCSLSSAPSAVWITRPASYNNSPPGPAISSGLRPFNASSSASSGPTPPRRPAAFLRTLRARGPSGLSISTRDALHDHRCPPAATAESIRSPRAVIARARAALAELNPSPTLGWQGSRAHPQLARSRPRSRPSASESSRTHPLVTA